MKQYAIQNQRLGHWRAYCGLLLITLVGLWPISTGIFSLKNDNIVYFLPYRFNIVEMIRGGHWPIWSPSVYMGFPIANDMQSGAWNPVVWLLALFGRYNVASLHIELLLYFFMAGIGLFKLTREFGHSIVVSFLAAVSYMFCGFMMDSGQIICWVACAAVLPFTYLYFLRILKRTDSASAAKFALSNCLLIVAGYPSFFIINLYLFVAVCIGLSISFMRERNYQRLRAIFSQLGLSGLLFLLTATVIWLSFLDMLPYYNRGHAISLRGALEDSFSMRFLLSAFWPFATSWANPSFSHDAPIFRNIYFGILLVPFAICGAFRKRSSAYFFIALLTLACFCFSLGNDLPFRRLAFEYLPLMNTFRHPANFRIFVIIGILLLAASALQDLLNGDERIAKFIPLILLLLLSAAALSATYYFFASEHLFKNSGRPLFDELVNGKLFNEAMFAGSVVQLIFLAAGGLALYQKKYRLFTTVAIVNVVAIAQPQIFYSIVSKESPSSISAFIRRAPKGFDTTGLWRPVGHTLENERWDYGHFTGVGSFYAKRPVINGSFNNPTILTQYIDFLRDSALVKEVSDYPVIYSADTLFGEASGKSVSEAAFILRRKDSSNQKVRIFRLKPGEISFSVGSDRPGIVSVFQNNYPGWRASMDNQAAEIRTVNHCFMALEYPPGKHLFVLKYRPRWFYYGLIASLSGLSICVWLILRRKA